MQTINGLPGEVFTASQRLVVKSCPSCGIQYAMPERLEGHANAQPSGEVTWYCPMGHSVVKTKSALDRAREEAERAQAAATHALDQARAARSEAEHERRRANGYKGVMTQTKKRAAKGVCPVPGCRRHFVDVERHVASKHPGWDAEA